MTCSRPGDSPKTAGACAVTQQTACTNPINSGTGNKYQAELDYVGAGAGPIKLERFYNSSSVATAARLGAQWRHSYDRSVSFNTNYIINTATVYRPDGKAYYYNQPSGGATWTPDADIPDKLLRLFGTSGNPTGWRYTNSEDEVETYGANGKLISIADRAGRVQTLSYSDGTATAPSGGVVEGTTTTLPAGLLLHVTDAFGRQLEFGYDAQLRVVRLTDPAGGLYAYTYDTANRLTDVSYPDGKTRGYRYNEPANTGGADLPNALTGLIDENGVRYASWTYDAQGRATSSEHGASGSGIDKITLIYNTDGSTSVTDAFNVTRSYGFQTILGVVKNTGISGQPCNGCGSPMLTYDTNGNIEWRTDWNGNRTRYIYDLARNLETSRTEGLTAAGAATAATRTIETAWHSTYRLPFTVTEKDAAGTILRSTVLDYDASGNLIGKTVTDPIANASRSWIYTYKPLGQRWTENGPRTDVTDVTGYDYDAQGNLFTVTDPLGHVTTLDNYDAHGRPGRITDPNGLITSLYYDARGRLKDRNAGGEWTSYGYDGAGNLWSVTLPNGALYTYTYDPAHRLTRISDPLGNYVKYTPDFMGNRTQEQIFDAADVRVQTRSRIFDILNRLYRDIGALIQTTTYAYDNNGNLTGIAGPMGHTTVHTYDALDRLDTTTDPAHGLTRYTYNALDALTQVTDPRSLVTQYDVDGLGNLATQTSPDTGITTSIHDAAGNLERQTDAKGQITQYSYDALNRVKLITYYDATKARYTYDQGVYGIGHLTLIEELDSSNVVVASTQYGYDIQGRVLNETRTLNGVARTTGYTWANGDLTGITYPSGRRIGYTLDTLGRIEKIQLTDLTGQMTVLASKIQYQPFGGVKSYVNGANQTVTRNYDQDGRISDYNLATQTWSVGYDLASRIQSQTDVANAANTAIYDYDFLDRLNTTILPTTSMAYDYDRNGNRNSQMVGSNGYTFWISNTSNRLTSISTVPAKSYTYDANGSVTGDGTNNFCYDARGRMTGSGPTNACAATAYKINALGQRVEKNGGAGKDTVYLYDRRGHLIAEESGPLGQTGSGGLSLPAGQILREYVYLYDLPLAVLQ